MTDRKLSFLLVLAMGLIFLAGNVTAQQKDFAEINNNGSSVSWNIKVPFQSVTLIVATADGQTFRKEFPAGSIPIFSPDSLTNGNYRYELIVSPEISARTKRRLRKARTDANGEKIVERLKQNGDLPLPKIQLGSFGVVNNRIVTRKSNLTENTNIQPTEKTKEANTAEVVDDDVVTPEDFVINDDLIADGSACIGNSCVNGEDFNSGTDTLRLKWNVLRIHFEDTSDVSNATNDWRITVNETDILGPGGEASFFAIDDVTAGITPFKIEAGAKANSLYVRNQGMGTGNVGIKTSTPERELHIRDGNSPTVRLEQDGSGGFTAKSWDIGGNESFFFITDNLDATKTAASPFKIRPNAPTDSLDVQGDGSVNIGKNLAFKEFVTTGTFKRFVPNVGRAASTRLFGGNGAISPQTMANAVAGADSSNSVMVANGVKGNVIVRFDIQSSPNLNDSSLGFIQYKIHYRDSDGMSNTDSRIRLTVYSVSFDDGTITKDQIFDSNTDADTTLHTVTVCKAVGANLFSFNNSGMYLRAFMQNRSVSGQTEFARIEILRVSSCF